MIIRNDRKTFFDKLFKWGIILSPFLLALLVFCVYDFVISKGPEEQYLRKYYRQPITNLLGAIHGKVHNTAGKFYENAGNNDKAFKHYSSAVKTGSPAAQYNMGRMYAEGKGTEKNGLKAYDYYNKSARQGNADAKYIIGQRFENEKYYPKAMQYYKESADSGNKDAANAYERLKAKEQSVGDKHEKRIEWFLVKARHGDFAAMQEVAISFHKLGNNKESLQWFLKLAKKSPDAQTEKNIGLLYDLEKDTENALLWYLKSVSKKADDEIEERIGTLYYSRGEYGKSEEWFLKAAEKGNAKAQNNLAALYSKGAGQVKRNSEKAAFWLEKFKLSQGEKP